MAPPAPPVTPADRSDSTAASATAIGPSTCDWPTTTRSILAYLRRTHGTRLSGACTAASVSSAMPATTCVRYFVYFMLPETGISWLQLEAFTAAVIALSLYTSTYVAEIIRGATTETLCSGQIQVQ